MTETPNPADFAESVRTVTEDSLKQAQQLVEAGFEQARAFADTIAGATLASVKRNQELVEKAMGTVSGLVGGQFESSLATLPAFDVRETVSAGFDLAKSVIDAQRELAERIIGAASGAAAV